MEPASKKAAPEEDDLLREAQLTSSPYHPLVSFLIPGDRIPGADLPGPHSADQAAAVRWTRRLITGSCRAGCREACPLPKTRSPRQSMFRFPL